MLVVQIRLLADAMSPRSSTTGKGRVLYIPPHDSCLPPQWRPGPMWMIAMQQSRRGAAMVGVAWSADNRLLAAEETATRSVVTTTSRSTMSAACSLATPPPLPVISRPGNRSRADLCRQRDQPLDSRAQHRALTAIRSAQAKTLNYARSGRAPHTALGILPEHRTRQARTFQRHAG